MLNLANAFNAYRSTRIICGSERSGWQPPGRMEAAPQRPDRSGTNAIINRLMFMAATAVLLSACSNPGKTSLDTNVPLTRDPALQGTVSPGTLVWRSPDLAEHERGASSYLIPPAVVYHGKGSDFANLDPQQLESIANDLTRETRTAIGHRFKVVSAPGPGVFRLELNLVKISPPAPAYISNGPYDWSESVVGMPNAQRVSAGTMVVSGKFIDAVSGKLLVGFVTPVSPQVMDMSDPSAPGSTSRFAQEATQQFATDLVAAIVRQRQINQVAAPR